MKNKFIAVVILTFIFMFSASAVAGDGQLATPVQTPTTGEEAPAAEILNCPNCGERINIGRHGQESMTVKCPHCGKEVDVNKMMEEENGLSYGADAGFFSKYVSRGVVTTDGPVFQPDIWVSYKSFTFSVWGNIDMTDVNGLGGNFNEADYTLDYSGSLNKLSYSAGLTYYTFPHTGADDTSEVYLGLGYDFPLNPKIAVYYDFWQADGFYGVFSLGHSFGLPKVWNSVEASLDLSAQVGLGSKNFNSFNFGTEHTAFTDLVLTASLPVTIFENVTVKPTVSYSTALDRTIRTKNFRNDNIIFGGVISVSF
jgi:DNA-directed RNA polymerase subunit RPC12/RpoP